MPTQAVTSQYHKLLTELRAEIAGGLARLEELLERQKVLSYWAIGRRISLYLHERAQPRGGVGLFYERLAADLRVNSRTLQQCEQFYRFFPSVKSHKNLKWSHYRFLLAVPDAARRRDWLERIKKEKIPVGELRLALLPPPKPAGAEPVTLKAPVRGRLYTYRLLRADDIGNFEIPWFVDIGFAARREAPPSKAALDNKYHYVSEKTKSGYRLKVVHVRAEELFTFRGIVRRVIDGDTLLVAVDQGFGYWSEQRLRLKGIDAPEMDTLAGQRAKKWVETELAGAGDVVVKTHKSDKWDRYLADVYYLPGESDLAAVAARGAYLNQAILDAGHGVIAAWD